MNDNEISGPDSKLGVAGWVAILSLIFFLGWALLYSVHVWDALDGTGISTIGWAIIVVGVVVTVALGVGLMGLVFYSSRKKFDR